MVRPLSVLGGLTVILAVSAASAQPPGGQGRGGFGRGFGMPQSGATLLAIPEVRTELGTTDEQNTKLDELSDDLREKTREAFEGFRDLSDEEQDKRREEVQTLGKEADAKVAEILKPEQVERLGQLRLQREGINAIARPDVAEKLGLTAEQTEKVKAIVEASRPRVGDFRDLSEDERRERFEEMQEQREKAQADLLALLTDEQKTKWEGLQGEKFEFPRRGGRRGR